MGLTILPLLFVIMMLVMRRNNQTNTSDKDEPKKEKPLPLLMKIFFGFCFVFFAVVILYIIDWSVFNGEYFHRLEYKRDCNFVVPAGYKITYNEKKEKYAVAVLEFGDYYLWEGNRGIEGMFSNISQPSTFNDSCDAKAFLKAFLNQNKPKF